MSYAALTDLQKVLNAMVLLDLADDSDSGTIDTTLTDNALETAGLEIDVYLVEGGYTLPLDPLPNIIPKLAVDIAVFNLYARRQGPPEHWQKRYDNAIKMLEAIKSGDLSLGMHDPHASNSDAAAVSSQDRIFDRDTLKNF